VLLSPGLWTVRRGNLDHELRLAAALAWLITPAKVRILISRLGNVPVQGS
jgi:hypothetical protein